MAAFKSDAIEKEILRLLDEETEVRRKDLLGRFKTSAPLVGYVLHRLIKSGKILKVGSTRGAYYVLNTEKNRRSLEKRVAGITRTYRNKGLEEHVLFERIAKELPRLNVLHDNIRSILFYAFTEMVNNAIEHSRSETVRVAVEVTKNTLRFEVRDFGVGVFNNVRRKRRLKDNYQSAAELLKGKTTTAPDVHTGEGIFFTSKAADEFTLDSDGFVLKIDNSIPDVFVHESKPLKGTKVVFEISLHSGRHLNRDVFGVYSTNPEEPAFDKTKIYVALYKYGTAQMSRSQARRIVTGLEKFKTVILDFDKIPYIGQAFADEIFRVFASRHPEVEIVVQNAGKAVAFMIDRVRLITGYAGIRKRRPMRRHPQ